MRKGRDYSELVTARESVNMTEETWRQEEGWESFIVENRDGFRYDLIGGSSYKNTLGRLIRRGAFSVIG